MYDLILCVLTSQKSKRLPIFQKIGYKKSSKYKTKIVYLVDTDDKPEYLGEDSDWYNCFGGVGPSYSCRFIEYLKNTYDEAKWIMQVDDDSCTDLDKTIDLLNYFYDYEDPVVLTGSFFFFLGMPRYIDRSKNLDPCFSTMIEPKMQKVIKDMEIENIFTGLDDLNKYNIMPTMVRGWEHSVFSCGSVNKIKKYNRLQEFVLRCAKLNLDFGDQAPFVLSKLAKIPISSCFFLSSSPSIEEYSAINKQGRFSHIHHICESWDQIEDFEHIIDENLVFDSAGDVESYFDSKKENTEWLFFHILENKIKARCFIKFLSENKISIINSKIKGLVSHSAIPEFDLNLNEKNYELEEKKWFFDEKNKIFVITNNSNQKIHFVPIKEKLYGCKVSDSEYYLLSKTHILDSLFWRRGLFVGTDLSRIN